MREIVHVLEHRTAQVFGVRLYYAVCYDCGEWVKSSVGQFVWLQRSNRNKHSVAHRRMYHA